MFRKIHLGFLGLLLLGGAVAMTLAQSGGELVDINSASLEQLVAVVGDELLAQKIVEGRPYANKRQILTRGLVSMEEYERITDRIIARRPPDPE